ncbi:hypothetical protein H4219_000583 [Mycoemilia scoparia]|uniref:C2 domain-containing protein n=1 Tax=Mycoemilia scoparia TaxID=417184 RepID=A0A9W8DWT5_9FUNG|nr:hypothetical protein H4219_000583 [Mycoemilia scoparia]
MVDTLPPMSIYGELPGTKEAKYSFSPSPNPGNSATSLVGRQASLLGSGPNYSQTRLDQSPHSSISNSAINIHHTGNFRKPAVITPITPPAIANTAAKAPLPPSIQKAGIDDGSLDIKSEGYDSNGEFINTEIPSFGNSDKAGEDYDQQAIRHPYSKVATRSSLTSFGKSMASLIQDVRPVEVIELQKKLDSVALDFSVDERVTYQYALRFALLLEEESRNAPPRMRLASYFNGHPSVQASNDVNDSNRPSTSSGDGSRYNRNIPSRIGIYGRHAYTKDGRVLSNYRQADHSNLNQEIPILPHTSFGEQFHPKNWRSSLADLGENAARLFGSADGAKLGIVSNIRQRKNQNSPIRPKTADPGRGHDDGEAKLTPDLMKSIIKCLGREVLNDSVHPFTKSCYNQLLDALKVKAFSKNLIDTGAIDDVLKLFAQFALIKCKFEQIIEKEDISRIIVSQVEKLVVVLCKMLNSKSSSRLARRACVRLSHYHSMNLPGVIPLAETSPPTSSRSNGTGFNTLSSTASLNSTSQHQQHHYQHIPAAAATTTTSSNHQSVSDWLQHIFKMQTTQHHYITQQLKQEATESNAVDDLKKWLHLTKIDRSFAGRPTDFISDPAYKRWKSREETSLDQLIVSFALKKTYNYSPFDTPASSQGPSSTHSTENYGSTTFHFVPENATAHFRKLIERSIINDIVEVHSASNNPQALVSLSTHSEDLLRQCAIGWRVSAQFRAICYLDIIADLVIGEKLPVQYLVDALANVEKNRNIVTISDWTNANQAYLLRVQSKVESYVLGLFGDILPSLHTETPSTLKPINSILRYLAIGDAWVDLQKTLCVPFSDDERRNCKHLLQPKISSRYKYIYQQAFGESNTGVYDFALFHSLAEKIWEDFELCKKLLPAKDLATNDRRYDIPTILFETEFLMLSNTLLDGIRQHGYSPDGANLEAALQLHNKMTDLTAALKKYSKEVIDLVDLCRLFRDNVDHWLSILERESAGWIKNALKMDNRYESSDINKHSSSANDLIVAFSQQVEMLQRIHWPNIEVKAEFITRFAKILYESFEKYAIAMEQAFLATLNRAKAENQNKKNYSVDKTTGLVYFTPEMCAKINNVAYVLDRLFDINESLGVAQLVKDLGGDDRPSLKQVSDENYYLFSVKVIRAEGLGIYKALRNSELDESARPYVKLITPIMEDGRTEDKLIGKTRRVPLNGMNPRWEQTFDCDFSRALEDRCAPIEVRVCTRGGPKKLGSKERTHARSYFPLSPRLFHQLDSSQDITLDLEPAGYLYLSITIDREKDDVEFYFGRMIRMLSRTQEYMETLIIEHISSYLREQLHQCVRTCRKKGKSLGIGDRPMSLLLLGQRRSGPMASKTENSEDALIPIFNYLENNLHMVYHELYYEVANEVILKVWNEVLVTFQDLLLPPLCGKSRSHKRLSQQDFQTIFSMVSLMKWYFNGGDDADGIPKEQLESQTYKELMAVAELYYRPVQTLIDSYIQSLRDSIIQSPITLSVHGESQSALLNTIDSDDDEPAMSPTEAKRQAQQLLLGYGKGSLFSNPVRRTHSVWMHKNVDSLNQLKKQSKLATDHGNAILRILKSSNERQATKFVKGQLKARVQQMRWEMRQIAEQQAKNSREVSENNEEDQQNPVKLKGIRATASNKFQVSTSKLHNQLKFLTTRDLSS